MLSVATLACSQPPQERFPQLIEGRDWKRPDPTIEAVAQQPMSDATDAPTLVDPTPTADPVTAPTVVEAAVEPVVSAAGGEVVVVVLPRIPQLGSLDRDGMLDVLTQAGWPTYLHEQALSVAWCESRWSPSAVNASSGVTGLFQLWSGWYRHAGVDQSMWSDPVVNARAAYGAYLYSGGWRQWQCQPS